MFETESVGSTGVRCVKFVVKNYNQCQRGGGLNQEHVKGKGSYGIAFDTSFWEVPRQDDS
jgi:hypothetical protein